MDNKKKWSAAAVITTIIAVTMLLSAFVFFAPEKADAASRRVRIQEIEYDREDREVNFDFIGRVSWRRPKITIYTMGGKKVSRYIIEYDNDDADVKVRKLKYGARYKYRISGIKRRGAGKYTTITGTFRAIDR